MQEGFGLRSRKQSTCLVPIMQKRRIATNKIYAGIFRKKTTDEYLPLQVNLPPPLPSNSLKVKGTYNPVWEDLKAKAIEVTKYKGSDRSHIAISANPATPGKRLREIKGIIKGIGLTRLKSA